MFFVAMAPLDAREAMSICRQKGLATPSQFLSPTKVAYLDIHVGQRH